MMVINKILCKADLKGKWMETATEEYEFPVPLQIQYFDCSVYPVTLKAICLHRSGIQQKHWWILGLWLLI